MLSLTHIGHNSPPQTLPVCSQVSHLRDGEAQALTACRPRSSSWPLICHVPALLPSVASPPRTGQTTCCPLSVKQAQFSLEHQKSAHKFLVRCYSKKDTEQGKMMKDIRHRQGCIEKIQKFYPVLFPAMFLLLLGAEESSCNLFTSSFCTREKERKTASKQYYSEHQMFCKF